MSKAQCRARDLLTRIISGTNICTLCLKALEGEPFDVHDEVYFQEDPVSNTVIIDVLSSLLALDEPSLTISNKLCRTCFQAAIASYSFIKMCHQSRKFLSEITDSITNCILDTDYRNAKSMYVTADVQNSQCKVYHDKQCTADNVKSALKRFKSVIKKRKVKKKLIKTEIEIEFTPINDFPDMDSNHGTDSDSNDKNTCKYCSRKFPDTKCLRAHFTRVHAPKNFKCNECPRKFGAAYLLKLHKSESHISVMCAECGKTYNNIHSLKMHSFTHAQLICPICERSYKTRNSFRKHVKSKICTRERSYGIVNRVEQKYICDVCSKAFAQKGSLQVHIKFKHENGDAYSCNWCGKKFPAQSRLKAHIVKHTRERNFTCEVCCGKFVSKAALTYHTRIHTGETPYCCPECDQKFLSASRRMDHIRRKHLGPTLECDICSSKFQTPSSLKKHKRRHFNPNSRLFTRNLENPTELPVICALGQTGTV